MTLPSQWPLLGVKRTLDKFSRQANLIRLIDHTKVTLCCVYRAHRARHEASFHDSNSGKYREVFWWSSPGTEQFRPTEGSNPTSGSLSELSRLDSIELQFVVPRNTELLNQVIDDGIRSAHPWEEPVIIVDKCQITGSF